MSVIPTTTRQVHLPNSLNTLYRQPSPVSVAFNRGRYTTKNGTTWVRVYTYWASPDGNLTHDDMQTLIEQDNT